MGERDAGRGGSGHGGLRAFIAMAVALVAAAVGAGFTARIFRRKEGHVLGEVDECEDDVADQEREAKIEELEEERKGREPPSFLENHNPTSPLSSEFTPPPPASFLASSEDDYQRCREIGGGDHVDVGAPLHVSDTMTKLQDEDERTHGSSSGVEEEEQVSDTREDESMSSDAYTKWRSEGTDSSHSLRREEKQFGMKSPSTDDEEAPLSGKKKKKKKKMVSGERDQEASRKEKVMIMAKNSMLYLQLTLSLAVVLAIILLLLLLGRHHDSCCHSSSSS